MAYLEALGALAAGDWNTTKYPGTCKPTNFTSLGIARELQTQLNRLAQALGLPKIAVDGDIGPGTMTLLKRVQAKGLVSGGDPVKAILLNTYANCSSVASLAPSLTLAAQRFADDASVPPRVTQPPPPKPVTIVMPSGAEVTAPPEYQSSGIGPISLGGGNTPLLLLALGGVGLFMYYEKGKGKGGGAKAATGSVRRRTSRRTTRRGRSRSWR